MSEPTQTPLSGLPTRLRRSPRAMAVVGLFALLALGYPLGLASVLAGAGVRGVAAALLAISLAAAVLLRGSSGQAPHLGKPSRAVLLGLLAVAATTGEPLALRLIVAVVYLALASLFWRSLRSGSSIIEAGVRRLEPATPEFVRSYCRKTTVLWSGFFLLNSVILAVLAVRGPTETWSLYSGRIVFVEMGVIFVVEFLVRKTWFRYYLGSNPFDRLWSFLFPAENTAAGRRSAEYIRRMKGR